MVTLLVSIFLTRSGFPRRIPAFNRKRIRQGGPKAAPICVHGPTLLDFLILLLSNNY